MRSRRPLNAGAFQLPADLSHLWGEIVRSCPYPMAAFQGPDLNLLCASPAFCIHANHEEDSLRGKAAAECLLRFPGCIALLKRVGQTGVPEQHSGGNDTGSWSYCAWRIRATEGAVWITVLQIAETSELHRRANEVNEALLMTALQQHEEAETTRVTTETMGKTIVNREHELDRTRDELRLLAAQLLQAQEDERRRIARELHDSFSQQLALFGMQMFHLEQEVSTNAGRVLMAKMQGQLEELAKEVRILSHQLHPPALEHLGLVTSLRALQEEIESTHSLPIRLLTQDLTMSVPLLTATTLYRIVQESLSNIIKHAGKDVFVTVQLRQTSKDLTLCIEDTGVGFDPQRTRANGGLGLISMQERARLVAGVMTVESTPGQGTKVLVRVPLDHVPEE